MKYLAKVFLGMLTALASLMPLQGAESSGGFVVTLGSPDSGANGYNLIVDSNVESPSTYAPRTAYLAATFRNTTGSDMTNLFLYIGNYTNNTPGIYPSRLHPPLVGPLPGGAFALTHIGGKSGLADATRFIPLLKAGEKITMFWLITYPNLDVNGKATWGPSVKADDDLWLTYDIWGTAQQNGTTLSVNSTRTVWMRNEISAMANKIYPNNAAKVPNEYQIMLNQYMPSWTNVVLTAEPGQTIITEGIWYDLGNVNQGFDLDPPDGVPDYNAWLQPVGDQELLDPSRFRLYKTETLLIVKLKTGENLPISRENQLYYNHLPENNGVVGIVKYYYEALMYDSKGRLTPYQEAASGSDNEKFNGDFGASGNPFITPSNPVVHLAKEVDILVTPPGVNLRYTVSFTNAGDVPLGNPPVGLPLVIQDSIPTGSLYVAGSAYLTNILPVGVSNYFVMFSTNKGTSWSLTEPTPATNVTDIQWWLNGYFLPGATGTVYFTVNVPAPYWPLDPYVRNTAGLSYGNTYPFLWAYARTLIIGTNALSGTVFWDNGSGGATTADGLMTGSEYGLSNVTVSLYYRPYSNGTLTLMAATNTFLNGTYAFTNLPDGYYEVKVDDLDSDIPAGSALTLPVFIDLGLDPNRTNVNPVISTNNNFAFCPTLDLTKTRLGPSPIRAGSNVTFEITVTNRIPGSAPGLTQYTIWATNYVDQGQKSWTSPQNAVGSPDGSRTIAPLPTAAQNTEYLDGYRLTNGVGTIVRVEMIVPSYVVPNASRDAVNFEFYNGGGKTPIYSSGLLELPTIYDMLGSNDTGTLVFDITDYKSWSWADFDNTNRYNALLTCDKGQGNNRGQYELDAVGLRITTTEISPSNNPHLTLDPVPLTDTFKTSELRYISASPPPLTVDTNGAVGTLYWPNLGPIYPGPLYPGGSRKVYVTFETISPPGGLSSNVFTNTCYVSDVYYQDGRPAGTATSLATIAVLRAGSIGDFVWWDMNGNGTQDVGEAGIPNVKVVLSSTNYPTVTNTTDYRGWYLFDRLPSNGVYTIRVLTNSITNAFVGAITNTYTEDGTRTNTTRVTLTNLEDHLTADFGYKYASFSNMIIGSVWHDMNRSGTPPPPDTGEPWLTNVIVYLYSGATTNGTPIATNRTTVNGDFMFVGNFSGTYSVRVVTNSGAMSTNLSWIQTYDTDNTNGVFSTPNYVVLSIQSNEIKRADFSYFRSGPYAIGDTVFYDDNGNGIWDSGLGEEGISNVTVRLYVDVNLNRTWDYGTDYLVGVTSTATNGYYIFENLPTTNYLVVVDSSDPDLPVPSLITADPFEYYDGKSYVPRLMSTNLLQDFGFYTYGFGTIGDYVWVDSNADGFQNEDYLTGINGVTVSLLVDRNGDGVYHVYSNTVTSAINGTNGLYYFTGIPDGSYRVMVSTNDTDIPTNSSGVRYVLTTPETVGCTIVNGNTFLDGDFGFASRQRATVTIGDRIFWDSNGDGQQGLNQTNEPGITGVTVRVYLDVDGDGVRTNGSPDILSGTAVTTTNGLYLFSGLPAGTYVVVVDTNSAPLANSALSMDPDADGVPVYTLTNGPPEAVDAQHSQSLAAGQTYLEADFGFLPRGVIGDTVWIDQNDNGIRDNELGIAGITVQLYTNGVLVSSTITDYDGIYTFCNLLDALYTVKIVTNDLPAGLVQNYDADGTLDSQAVNIRMTNGHVVAIGPVTYTNPVYGDLNADFGYRYPGTNMLSGTVGMDDPTYNGVMGTGPSGYSSNEVPFIGHQVWLSYWEDNGNNILEAGELRPMLYSVNTDSNGDFVFTNLPSSTNVNAKYLVTYTPRDRELQLTTTNGVTPATVVSNIVDIFTNTISAWQGVPMSLGPVITGVDFAFKGPPYDYGDLPQSYSTLLQYLPEGARNRVKPLPDLYLGATVDTEINGVPSVNADGDNLAASNDEDGVIPIGVWQNGSNGLVQVTVGKGSGWLLAYMDFNNNGTFNDFSDMVINQAASANGASPYVYTNTFTVASNTFSGTSATVIYSRFRLFGSQPPYPQQIWYSGTGDNGETEDYRWEFGAIGDTVWKDSNVNGIRDNNEPPLTNMIVYVDVNGDGNFTSGEPFARTDTDGYYHIGGFTPGVYTVRVDTANLPAGLFPVFDLDGTATPNTAVVTMTNAQVRMDVDFGYAPMTLGGMVWYDWNSNGIRGDVIEEQPPYPMTNIPVRLRLAGDNTTLATTNTGADGRYFFEVANEGTYYIEFTPGVYTVSTQLFTGATNINDVSPSTFRTIDTTINAGEVQNHWDMGVSALTDLGITKFVNEAHPTTNEIIWYTMVLTNNGPRDAISCTVTDIWPAEITYQSYWATQGTYDPVTRLWSVGRVDVGHTATLIVTGQVNVVGNRTITNTVWIRRVIPNDTNPFNNTSQVHIVTLAVVSRFEALDNGSGTVLEWETASEAGTAGFYLSRQVPGKDQFVRVCDDLMPAVQGAPQGGIYRIVDPAARPGENETYRLDELEVTGGIVTHGPYSVRIPSSKGSKSGVKTLPPPAATGFTSRERGSPEKEARFKARDAANALSAQRSTVSGGTRLIYARTKNLATGQSASPAPISVKLEVTNNAVYYADAAAIAGLLQLTPAEVSAAFAAGAVRLTCVGNDVSYVPAANGAGLFFYGQKADSIYTDANAYWLTMAGGKTAQVAAVSAPATAGVVSARTHTAHFEKNLYAMISVLRDPEADYWMWDYVFSSTPAYSKKQFTLTLTNVAVTSGTAALTVNLQGASLSGVTPEHHAQVRLNGQLVGECLWTGLNATNLACVFNQSLLRDGSNNVEVTALKETGVANSIVYIGWFDVTYNRTCVAAADQLTVLCETGDAVTATGFTTSGIRVMDVSNPRTPVLIESVLVEPDNGLYRASFTPVAPGSTCVMFADGMPSPAAMKAVARSSLKDLDNAIDHAVITTDDLSATAASLAEYRSAQGLRSRVILLEDIYNEFNYGVASPHAIEAFTRYAWRNWHTPPRYLLLAGEGTYDYKNYKGFSENIVPVMMISTPQGLYPSDNPFADIDEDGLPELAVGRLPVLTADELRRLIDRIKAYESGAPEAWQKRIILMADNADNGGDFAASSDLAAGFITSDYQQQKVYMPNGAVGPLRAQLLPAINDGAIFMSYFGHGGLDRFSSEGLLTSADAASLTNGTKLPVVLALSCMVGHFATPGFDCISEAMLMRDGGGAIAVWAPSGLSMDDYAGRLGQNFYDAVFRQGEAVLGETVLSARQKYAADQLTKYVPRIYNLLGDPALGFAGMVAQRRSGDIYRADITFSDTGPGGVGTDLKLTNRYVAGLTYTSSVPASIERNGIRYICTGWTGTGCIPATGTATYVTFTAEAGSTLIWQWRQQFRLTAAAGLNGTINNTGGWYDSGSIAVLTAAPDRGYRFIGWTGDAASGANPLSLNMIQAVSVTAGFTVRHPALAWQLTTGQSALWSLSYDGTTNYTRSLYNGATTWKICGAGDIDGDGIADLVWQLPTGQIVCWYLDADGSRKSGRDLMTSATTWLVRSVSDLDGDGIGDLIWQLPSGQVACWYMNRDGTWKSTLVLATAQTTWLIRGSGDMDGDGIADLIWQLPTGQVAGWYMNRDGTRRGNFSLYAQATDWQIRGVLDLDNDGIADLIWQLPTGQTACWLMNNDGTRKSGKDLYPGTTSWQIRGAGN